MDNLIFDILLLVLVNKEMTWSEDLAEWPIIFINKHCLSAVYIGPFSVVWTFFWPVVTLKAYCTIRLKIDKKTTAIGHEFKNDYGERHGERLICQHLCYIKNNRFFKMSETGFADNA